MISRPVTYRQAADLSFADALMRYQLLSHRDRLSKTAAGLRPPGRRHRGAAAAEPLTVNERVELLTLGVHLARHFRDPVMIHDAVRAAPPGHRSRPRSAGSRSTSGRTMPSGRIASAPSRNGHPA